MYTLTGGTEDDKSDTPRAVQSRMFEPIAFAEIFPSTSNGVVVGSKIPFKSIDIIH